MMIITRILSRSGVLVVLAGLVLIPLDAWAADDDLRVIVNSKVQITAISKDELKSIFMGKKTFWAGQSRITPIDRPVSITAGRAFFKTIVGMTPGRYRHYWNGLELSGRGVRPRTAMRVDDVGSIVRSDSGAIAIVTVSELSKLSKYRVKVITVRE